MWNGNLLVNVHDITKRCYYFLSLISNSIIKEKLIYYPDHHGKFLSGMKSLNYGGFICMAQEYDDQKLFQMMDIQTWQKIDFIKTEMYWGSYFFRDLNLGFAFSEQYSFKKISLLTQSNFTIKLNFTKEIQEIVVCSQSYSLLVLIYPHLVYTVNLIPLLKSKQNLEININ